MIPTTSLTAAKDATRRIARSRLGVARLTPAQALDADQQAEAIFAAAEAASKAAVEERRISDAPRAAVARVIAAVYPLRQTVNGATLYVNFGPPGLVATTARDWTSVGRRYNSGMGCTASTHRVTVPADWLDMVYVPGLAVIDGVLTLSAELMAHPPVGFLAWRATWARQSHGTSVMVERGYLVRRIGGTEVVHAATWEAGIRLLARRAKPADRKPARRVTLALATRLGLCRTGSLAWAHRHLTPEEVTQGWITPDRFREAVAAAGTDSVPLTARVLDAIGGGA